MGCVVVVVVVVVGEHDGDWFGVLLEYMILCDGVLLLLLLLL